SGSGYPRGFLCPRRLWGDAAARAAHHGELTRSAESAGRLLRYHGTAPVDAVTRPDQRARSGPHATWQASRPDLRASVLAARIRGAAPAAHGRSEERRVGKESRSGGPPYGENEQRNMR